MQGDVGRLQNAVQIFQHFQRGGVDVADRVEDQYDMPDSGFQRQLVVNKVLDKVDVGEGNVVVDPKQPKYGWCQTAYRMGGKMPE